MEPPDDASASTGEKRHAAFAELDRELMHDAAPLAPLVVVNTVGFTSARLACVSFHPYTTYLNLVAACIR